MLVTKTCIFEIETRTETFENKTCTLETETKSRDSITDVNISTSTFIYEYFIFKNDQHW